MSVYRKAAKMVSAAINKGPHGRHYRGCCTAIRLVSGGKIFIFNYKSQFVNMFMPTLDEYRNVNGKRKVYVEGYWMGPRDKDSALSRSLALLFMHEMVRSGDL